MRRIRQADKSDAAAIRAFYAECGYSGGLEPEDLVLLAEDSSGVLLGVVRLCTVRGELLLRGLQVKSSVQGRGVGRALMAEAVQRLRGRRCYCIPYRHLRRFYGAYGFAKVSHRQTPPFLAERLNAYHARGLGVILMMRPATHSGDVVGTDSPDLARDQA